MYYVFRSKNDFNKFSKSEKGIVEALSQNKKNLVFEKVSGIPNPWFVHPFHKGKVDKTKVLNPSKLDLYLRKYFRE